jgi:hypothetical protein
LRGREPWQPGHLQCLHPESEGIEALGETAERLERRQRLDVDRNLLRIAAAPGGGRPGCRSSGQIQSSLCPIVLIRTPDL